MGFSPTSGPGGGGASAPLTLTGSDPADVQLKVLGAAAQSVDLAEITNAAGTEGIYVTSDGSYYQQLAAGGSFEVDGPGFPNFQFTAGGAFGIRLGSDFNFLLRDSAGAAIINAEEAGRLNLFPYVFCDRPLVIGANAAPADGNLNADEAAIWFDSTVGAAKLMIKAKNSAGTVVTGSVNLA